MGTKRGATRTASPSSSRVFAELRSASRGSGVSIFTASCAASELVRAARGRSGQLDDRRIGETFALRVSKQRRGGLKIASVGTPYPKERDPCGLRGLHSWCCALECCSPNVCADVRLNVLDWPDGEVILLRVGYQGALDQNVERLNGIGGGQGAPESIYAGKEDRLCDQRAFQNSSF